MSSTETIGADRLLTTAEAAAFLTLKKQTLNKWRMNGEHLRFVRVGRAIRYRLSDLQQFIEDRTTPTAS